MKSVRLALIIVAVLAVLVTGGTWLYINVINDKAPAPLTVNDAGRSTTTKPASSGTGGSSTTGAAAGSVEGSWKVSSGSTVGYRVKEVLFGQSAEAVGRTEHVTGSLTIAGTAITEARFEVDVATITSDQSRRDAQFTGRVMDAAAHPTASFRLTKPIQLGSIPPNGTEITETASGELTLRGTSKPVEIKLTAKRDGDTIKVAGSYDVVFADWSIPNPSFGPVTTEDHGLLEFALAFNHV